MIVDISKYNCYQSTPDIMSNDAYINKLDEPFTTSTDDKISYFIEELNIYFLSQEDWDIKPGERNLNFFRVKKLDKPYEVEFPNKLYLPNTEIPYKIPYEYYSRADIENLDFIIPKDFNFTPRFIKFKLDCCGRLHVRKEDIEVFIYCMENKIPEIQAEVIVDNTYPTNENQVELAEKYLTPYFLLNKTCEDIYDYISKKDSVAYNILKKCPYDRLKYFKQYFVQNTVYPKYLAGFIFEDGSHLLFFFDYFYHDMFLYFIAGITKEYAEDHYIKLNNIVKEDIPVTIYRSSALTTRQKLALRKFRRKYYLREQDLDLL